MSDSNAAQDGRRPTKFTGRAWILLDEDKTLYDDVDTDLIYHNEHLAVTDIEKMGQFALGNLDGYEDFAANAEPGDIVFAGSNFGAGSSRQQAVDCFKSLGINCIVARSYGAIYKRNAINAGFPILIAPALTAEMLRPLIRKPVTVSMTDASVTHEDEPVIDLEPVSHVQLAIYQAGDLFSYAKRLEEERDQD